MRGNDFGVLTIVVLLGAGAPAGAQTTLRLTLDEAVRRGVEQAPRAGEARAREAAADAVRESRRALGLPAVTVSAGLLRTNHVDQFGVSQPDGRFRVIFPDIPTNYRVRSEVSVPVFTAGRVEALVEAASAGVRAAGLDRAAVEADVRLEVSRAYWRLVVSRDAIAVMERALARAEAWVADARARVEAGVLPPNDVLTAETQRARQAVRVIQARQEATMAEAALARLIAADPDDRIDPTTAATEPSLVAAELAAVPVSTLVARARTDRAERAGLEARVAASRAGGEAARAGRRPQLTAVAGVEPARPNPRFVPRTDAWQTSWDVAVAASWTVWDGGRARAEEAAAAAEAAALTHRLREFDAAVSLEVRARVLALEAGEAAIEASSQAVAASAEARRVTAERLAVGVATSAEVLDAEVAQLEAELEQIRLHAAQRIAEAELVRAVGGR